MGSIYKILIAIFFLLSFSFLSIADEKVYTNADLKPGPTLKRDSRIDPATGKEIKEDKDASRKQADSENIVNQAKKKALSAVHEIKTNKTVLVGVIGLIVLLWIVCLLDILRFEFRGNNKLIWFIAVTFIPLAGCILYLFIGRRQKKYRIIKDYE